MSFFFNLFLFLDFFFLSFSLCERWCGLLSFHSASFLATRSGTPLLNFQGLAQRCHASFSLSRADLRFLQLSTNVALSKSGFKQRFLHHSRSFSAASSSPILSSPPPTSFTHYFLPVSQHLLWPTSYSHCADLRHIATQRPPSLLLSPAPSRHQPLIHHHKAAKDSSHTDRVSGDLFFWRRGRVI
jgi:hypothetical protein